LLSPSDVRSFQPNHYSEDLQGRQLQPSASDGAASFGVPDPALVGFQDLDNIFDDSFLSMQRVSMYGGSNATMPGSYGLGDDIA